MLKKDYSEDNRQDQELKARALKAVERNLDKVTEDPYRLRYHITPPVGLLNDPNGFVYFNGKYHLFYQWNPFATKHGPKFWAHVTSVDLVNWQEEPIALAPSSWFDKDGCYSGSAIVHEGKLYLFYTGNVRDAEGNRETYQCLAFSEDGIDFEKKGPVIYLPEGFTAHFRDPKVWKKDENWYMVIGAQTEEETGTVVLYRSDDLTTWKFLGPITEITDLGYMWECPDLFSLNDKDILLFSPQGVEPEGFKYRNIYQTGYFLGQFDYERARLKHGMFEELDRGFDFYAPQTMEDHQKRRLLFGWMGVPEENEQDHPTITNDWIHAMTIPRQLELKGEKLYQKPVKEIEYLRNNHISHHRIQMEDKRFALSNVSGNNLELQIEISEMTGEDFSVLFGKHTLIKFDRNKQLFTLTRKSFKTDTLEERHCKLSILKDIRIFLDKSSIEVFLNDGEEVFTARVFDDPHDSSITFYTTGKTTINVDKWQYN